MRSLLVVGAGGHGRVVAEAALDAGLWTRIAFLDDRHPRLQWTGEWPVVGDVAGAGQWLREFPETVVAIGDNPIRLVLLERLQTLGFSLPVVIHPRAAVSGRAELGAGTVVLAQAAVNIGARLGQGCIVNTGSTVDHDCRLGVGVHLGPGSHLCGGVRIGARTLIGVGACVRPGVMIGADTTVGAGSAVVATLPDGVIATGVPARQRK